MKSLKNQLILIFSGFVLFSVFTAIYTAYSYEKKIEIFFFLRRISETESTFLKALREQENYYNFEIINEDYFQKKESSYLRHYDSLFVKLTNSLKKIEEENASKKINSRIREIQDNLESINLLFAQMREAIVKRGFKNYGIEGEMRESVHLLESIPELKLEKTLMLRRHEKDFILRQEKQYLDKHRMLVNTIRETLFLDSTIESARKKQIVAILQRYVQQFDQVVMFERMIGLKSNTGFKQKLSETTALVDNNLQKLIENVDEYLLKKEQNLRISLIVFWLLYLMIAIWLSIRVAQKFTKRLTILSSRINYFVNTNFTAKLRLEPNKRKDEVGTLWNNFIKMEGEILEHIELFKEKVYEKTNELSDKNEQIEIQKNILLLQKEESDRKNKDLMDGMRYAWRIQRALLPDNKRFEKQLRRGFVFFMPKDIVSGDIYWTHKIKNQQQEESIFSVIDCTGHGVPGAFMSILAVNAINHAVLNKQCNNPAKILQITNDYVYKTMKYYNTGFEGHHLNDGMDMLLCKLNRQKNEVEYAGANRPLFLVRKYKNEKSFQLDISATHYKITELNNCLLFEILPTKKTLGTQNEKDSKSFRNKNIRVEAEDMLYLTSDGYADQFGGSKNKKFMLGRLKNLFTLIHDLKEEEQKSIIKQTIIDWKGEEEQVDDITILGIRV